jgi:leucyl aminopeptidase
MATLVYLALSPTSIAAALALGFALASYRFAEFYEEKSKAARKATEVIAEKALSDANKRFEELSDDVQKLKLALRIRTGV